MIRKIINLKINIPNFDRYIKRYEGVLDRIKKEIQK